MKGNTNEAHLPTEHSQACEDAWLPCPHVDQGRPRRAGPSPRKRAQAPYRLKGLETIKSSSDINAMFEEGRRMSAQELSLIVLRNEKQHGQKGRVAFIAGKKLGNAVWRNRAKRRMRALCQSLGGPFEGHDVVFLARRQLNEASWDNLTAHTRAALLKAGLLNDD